MEAQSPPKRMTRARAAAKASTSETGPKTTKIMTAAAKAKAAPASTRATASSKRKTRSDEEEGGDDDSSEPAAHLPRARGRPKKKTDDAEETSLSSSAPGRATRARAAARKATADAPKAESAPTEPVKPIRGRPRKNQPQDEAGASAEPLRKTTRTRATTTTPTNPTKPVVKKKVTFEEPEKENVHPGTGKKDGETNASGLRARPVRKAPIPKTTRTTAKAEAGATKEAKKTPLSPKKVTQMPHTRDDSEDELTAERTPVKPMMKSPVKPPGSAVASLMKPELPPKEADPFSQPEPEAEEAAAAEVVFGSPARRPPASPFKDSMKSPAKRIEGMSLPKPMHSTQKSSGECAGTPFKTSLLGSPAKRPQSAIKGLNVPVFNRNATEERKSPTKTSFLQSPAKRSTVPLKGMPTPKIHEPAQGTDGNGLGTQASATAPRSPITSPVLLATLPGLSSMTKSSHKLMIDEQEGDVDNMVGELAIKEPETLDFPGRLSAVLPRHADPALKDNMAILHDIKATNESPLQNDENDTQGVVAEAENTLVAGEIPADNDHSAPMDDELEPQTQPEGSASPTLSDTPSRSPSKKQQPLGIFGLREKDMNPYRDLDWEDSEDEVALSAQRGIPSAADAHDAIPATPTPASSSRQPSSSRAPKLGFTPLAKQFYAWSTASPVKAAEPSAQQQGTEVQGFAGPDQASPTTTAFFDDEMSLRGDIETADVVDENDIMVDVDEPEFNDVLVTDQDVELAAEADEMSLMEPQQEEDDLPLDVDDGLSEASQEYADENEMPLDPALSQQGPVVPPKTPLRVISREFHTTSKVPLKGADESTPRPKKKKRAASISRLPVTRPTHGLTRSATVISYSPMKNNHDQDDSMGQEHFAEHEPQQSAPTTPTKSETWSSVETPARTPRRDLNVTLLSGAVVFVDVHTSEGADASGIFVELLSQMGARCVKNWTWNPDGSTGSDSSKIGITHVVYKDGGKRTMEKVRESGGVVQCVGVSWVLDCERSNEWLDEAPYYIDTSLVPRGGSRRRKSMEPRALANMNGNLVPTPAQGGRDAQTAPNTPMNRRDSTAWMRTPSDQAEDDDQDWQALLTPVPKTPAPEALARYAADVTPETPTAAFDFGDDESPLKNAALMQTCPPKPNTYRALGHGILDREKDEGVLQRLMAARRKSLQFAPKIGSPLSRTWK